MSIFGPFRPKPVITLESLQHQIDKNREEYMADLSKLQAAIAAQQTTIDQVVAELKTTTTDQAAVDAATAQITTNTATLAAALPTPPPAPAA